MTSERARENLAMEIKSLWMSVFSVVGKMSSLLIIAYFVFTTMTMVSDDSVEKVNSVIFINWHSFSDI